MGHDWDQVTDNPGLGTDAYSDIDQFSHSWGIFEPTGSGFQDKTREPTVHQGPLLTAIERRGLQVEVTRRREWELAQAAQERLQRSAEFARLEQEGRHLQGLFVSLSTDIAAARQVRDQTRAGPGDGTDGLSAWRESARRRREAALQKPREREGPEPENQREKGRHRGRDGPDYER